MEETTTNKFNEEWEKLRPTIIQLSTDTTTKDETQIAMTELALKYLPYFAKLKTDTPVTGQCYVDVCISIILEKTSS